MNATIPGTPYPRRFNALWTLAHNLRGRERITYGDAVTRFGRKFVNDAIKEGAVYAEQEMWPIRDPAQVTSDMQLRANCQTVA